MHALLAQHLVLLAAWPCAGTSITHPHAGLALFFGTFGDTVCQAAQAFLPPSIGSPERSWRLARALMLCGTLIACFNAVAGTLVVAYGLPLFTSSAMVQHASMTVLPLFSTMMLLHCCSMSTEGILLATRESAFLCASYAAVFCGLKVRLLTCGISDAPPLWGPSSG
jgi:hypothetical protein